MPILKYPQWECFARTLAAGATLTDAYNGAGYKGGAAAHANARRLLRRDCVRARVEELQAKELSVTRKRQADALKAAGVDYAWLRRKGVAILEKSIEKEDFAAASHTLERIAKLCGLWVERSLESQVQTIRVQRIYSDAPLTEEEWERMRERLEAADPGERNSAA